MDYLMFIFCLVIPLIMIILGIWLAFSPPKSANGEAGDPAQAAQDGDNRRSGRLWIWVGSICLFISVGLYLLFGGSDLGVIAIALIQWVMVTASMWPIRGLARGLVKVRRR